MASNTFFQFKQFVVHQERTAMKVGTDGVLLGALAHPVCECADDAYTNHVAHILDIGTGTGLIALMMAQRFPSAHVTAVEIDPDAASQARDNAAASPFAGRVEVVEADATTFGRTATSDATSEANEANATAGTYQLVVSNPPYFTQSLKCPDGQRTTARHTVSLTYGSLMATAARVLAPGGTVAVIVPFDQRGVLESAASDAGLYPAAVTVVKTNERKPPRRIVELFTDHRLPQVSTCETTREITLLEPDGSMSRAYRELAADFYLDR